MTTPGRQFNDAVTRFWSLAAPIYDLPHLQRWIYQPAQDDVIAQLRARGARRIADIACGTGILAARIADELQPDEVYGVDMSDGMLTEARARSSGVATISPPLPPILRRLSANPANPAHNPSPAEMRALFADAGFTVTDQHRVQRPVWTRGVWDLLTLGVAT